MKKIRKIFITVATAALSLFTLVASGCNAGAETAETEHTHAFSDEWSYDETYHWHAATCGHDDEVADKQAHTFGEGKITAQPTCTDAGTVRYECDECGYYYTQEIPATGHNWGEWEKYANAVIPELGMRELERRTCSTCGETEYRLAPDAAEIYIVSAVSADENAGVAGGAVQLVRAGQSVTVTASANLGYRFVCWSDGSTEANHTFTPEEDTVITANFAIDSLDLPYMVINTENNQEIVSKEDYISCTVSVGNAEEAYEFTDKTGKIRGRGNTTWVGAPKKPYKLKFDKKIDLFGNGEAKTWTLIANYFDKSMVRNYLAYSIGSQFETLKDSTTTTQFVDLYLNGEYAGVYLVCEQNQTGANRVDITEDFTDDPADTGYLVELDSKYSGTEGVDYFFVNGTPYSISGPDFDDIDDVDDIPKYIEYITAYLENCLEALSAGDYEGVKNLIDVESFAESYIVHELFHCADVNHTSFYMYKDAGGKLTSGPIWDFDLSSGNCRNDEYGDINNTNKLYATISIWYSGLLQYGDFKKLVAEKLAQYKDLIRSTIAGCEEYVFSCGQTFERNFERWDILEVDMWPNPAELVAITTWRGQVEYVAGWLNASLDYLLEVYPYDGDTEEP